MTNHISKTGVHLSFMIFILIRAVFVARFVWTRHLWNYFIFHCITFWRDPLEEGINTTRGYLEADYAVKSSLQNIHMKLGLFHKTAARRQFHNSMKHNHPHMSVKKCELILHDSYPYLAASPDGLVQCSHCQPSQDLVEIKCPSAHRNVSPQQAR